MKKWMAVVLMVLVAMAVSCQTKIIVGSTLTVEWDAVGQGTIPASEISYEVVYTPYPSGAVVLVATVATLEAPITFTVEGAYRIGVRTKRTVAADGTVLYSEYLWGDIEGSPQPFYVVYYTLPARIERVRIR